MFIDFFVTDCVNHNGVKLLCSIDAANGGFVPRVGEYSYVPGSIVMYVVRQVTTSWVHVPGGLIDNYYPRVRVDVDQVDSDISSKVGSDVSSNIAVFKGLIDYDY